MEVLNGGFSDQIDEYIIIDSRYPYEYEGGHIHNALNIFTKDKLFEEMFIKRNIKRRIVNSNSSSAAALHHPDRRSLPPLQQQEKSDVNKQPAEGLATMTKKLENKRVIIIFHCEFSSERGPSLLRFLRNQDRALNEDVYPYLHYPELYLLEGGYKSFYENFKVNLFF